MFYEVRVIIHTVNKIKNKKKKERKDLEEQESICVLPSERRTLNLIQILFCIL